MTNSKDHTRFNEKITRKVNEIYHDLTYDQYDSQHPEIFKQESKRFRKLIEKYIKPVQNRTILDLGTGTGFVPINLSKVLHNNNRIICTDISKKILNQAQHNIEKFQVSGQFRFLKNNDYHLPLENNSVNVAIMNSVLHHLNKYQKYLDELDRVLIPGGLLIISHEPNRLFYQNKFLIRQFKILNKLINIKKLPQKIFIKEKNEKLKHKLRNTINTKIKEAKLTKQDLSYEDLLRIIDIRDREGFIAQKLQPSYSILDTKTYDHLHWIIKKHPNNTLLKKYDHWLAKKYPNDGATFTIVMRKKREAN